MNWKRKDLLGIRDLSKEEMLFILDTAESFKDISKREIKKVPTLGARRSSPSFTSRAPGRAHLSR
jgi:aspartate carbamoyltransferase catalytic subunit